MSTATPAANAHLAGVPAYQPGRSAEALMREHGLASAIKLASNETPFGPLPGVPEAVAAAVAGLNRYADHTASAVASLFASTVGVERSHVAVGPGTVGLLEQLALAFAGPGHEVLYPWPSFIAYPQFTQLTAATPVTVPLVRQGFDVSAILDAVTERTRMVLIAHPNNPTSTALRTAELQRLVDGLPADCLVVIDEAYREFVTGADVPDALSLFAGRPNVAVLRTLSKAYSLAGLRIGFLVAHEPVVDAVNAALIPFAVNGLAQAAAVAALSAADEVARRCALITAERDALAQALRRRGLGVPDSQSNFLWLPSGSRTAALVGELERRGVATRGLGVGIRVTVSTADENAVFLSALDEALGEQPELADDWGLPLGERADATAAWLDRLDVALARLRRHGSLAHSGLTKPVPGEVEQWEAGQVWAHLAEFGDYWQRELLGLLAAASTSPVAFGRTRRDVARIEAIERGRSLAVGDHLDAVERSADRLRALLTTMSDADWSCVGLHSTLGEMSVDRQLDEFLVGHYEQHADQLDELLP